ADALNVGFRGSGNIDLGDDTVIVEEAMNLAGAVDVISDDFAGGIDGFSADACSARNGDVGNDSTLVDKRVGVVCTILIISDNFTGVADANHAGENRPRRIE